jgi:hypothetical protein
MVYSTYLWWFGLLLFYPHYGDEPCLIWQFQCLFNFSTLDESLIVTLALPRSFPVVPWTKAVPPSWGWLDILPRSGLNPAPKIRVGGNLVQEIKRKTQAGWWFQPLWQILSVGMIIPNWMGKMKHVPNHQTARISEIFMSIIHLEREQLGW